MTNGSSPLWIYTRDGSLWRFLQLWDSIALFYNKDLTDAAGVDVEDLTWAPDAGDGDTLLPALQKLTTDKSGNTAESADSDSSNVATFGLMRRRTCRPSTCHGSLKTALSTKMRRPTSSLSPP